MDTVYDDMEEVLLFYSQSIVKLLYNVPASSVRSASVGRAIETKKTRLRYRLSDTTF